VLICLYFPADCLGSFCDTKFHPAICSPKTLAQVGGGGELVVDLLLHVCQPLYNFVPSAGHWSRITVSQRRLAAFEQLQYKVWMENVDNEIKRRFSALFTCYLFNTSIITNIHL
jgi:hypothetical protein